MPTRIAAFLLAAASVALVGSMCAQTVTPALPPLPMAPPDAVVSYREQVRPILENRCVVCHGCYDAPCQLVLSSHAGLDRGATKQVVYGSSRLREADPTRLFTDAGTTAEWRERGFFSVVDAGDSDVSGPLLLRMLALGRARSFEPDRRLPDDVPLDINRSLSCPAADEFDAYALAQPHGGMPYGTAPLSDAELGVLASWVGRGATPPSPPPAPSGPVADAVARWETFLNGESLKQRITARYLYEHWFVAHLYFEDVSPDRGPFFEIVRSKTPPGAPIDPIASRRPYDAPGVDRFWYRLRPVDETIVHKTHIVYALGDAKMARLEALFLATDWQPTAFPAYGADASNPFETFHEVPARSRYQYLLDDAQYFVMTFIRGPVCRGQVAVDVIQDHFFVAFLDPDYDASVTDPHFFERTQEFLDLPAENESQLALGGISLKYQIEQKRYLAVLEEIYREADPEGLGPSLDFLWDGDGHDRDALLTVFRNFDNATVVRGFLGAVPKTAWVMHYPIFERIYYDLVAGFDVFGNVTHQISTRLYMDDLRMQSENMFLAFLPEDRREEIRASWYVGATRQLEFELNAMQSGGHGTQVPFATEDVKTELIESILAHGAAVAGPPDLLNRCGDPPCERPGATPFEQRTDRALQPLAGVTGPWVAELPELTLLRVRSGQGPSAVYTLVHNRSHTNVASMFEEGERLEPEKDTVTLASGFLGSYPNFLFDVEASQIEAFASALAAVAGPADMEMLVDRFGMRRTSPRFWATFDWIHEDFLRRRPVEAGLFDLARYGNL